MNGLRGLLQRLSQWLRAPLENLPNRYETLSKQAEECSLVAKAYKDLFVIFIVAIPILGIEKVVELTNSPTLMVVGWIGGAGFVISYAVQVIAKIARDIVLYIRDLRNTTR